MRKSNTLRIVINTLSIALSAVALSGCSALGQLPGATDAAADATLTPRESDAGSDETTARRLLDELTVAPDGSQDGYDRDRFPHWSNQGDNCNTREIVLKRDGTDVEVGADCYPTSGSWPSPYDGHTWTDPSDVDIDHVVPLAEAWRTGAADWTDSERERFANDLDGANLLAVTDNVNQSKGDAGPEEWQPPLESYWCTYAIDWIDVKHTWRLTIEQAEKTTLGDMLDRC